ncbi:response regulator transcription factor [Flavobacterium sp. LS1P28]|uniref:response regulator transcription factor n=1 Tax=Flavobacterium sp. LS1P28 TaxID=2497752 RepID=UPI000F8191AF|nr:response regulator [Flavobacterium sp. LS1P28]RTY84343.1 response regulator transcription factor [Flavobacterium sp. LS1P28]
MINQKSGIVLIEDDVALGNSISELLSLSGFNVNWFKDGIDALLYLNKHIPDIIISDLMMPNMNGEDLYFNIKKNGKLNAVPFVIITANIDDSVQYKLLENGVNDFIVKPFKVRELIFKVNNLLEFKNNIEKKFKPDPFSKVTIKLSEKDFLTSVNEHLLNNLKLNVDIDELSKQLFICKSTLDKRIRKLTNKNISQYMREFRLDYAIKLIHLGERNIQFLVHETGFNSFSYFTTSFKLYSNLTPRDYIKSIHNDSKLLENN